MSENAVYVAESQEDQGQSEEGGFISPKNGSTIDLTVTSASDPMSLYNTDDELFILRAPIDNPKPSSQPTAATSY